MRTRIHDASGPLLRSGRRLMSDGATEVDVEAASDPCETLRRLRTSRNSGADRALWQRLQTRLFREFDEPVEVGRYLVQGRIGKGVGSIVYRALDRQLEREVALEVLSTPPSRAEADVLGELRAVAALRHENVVPLYDAGFLCPDSPLAGGHPLLYVASAVIEGRTLEQWLLAQRRKPAEISRVLAGAGRGLAAAHAQGVVHRGFHPGSIRVDESGRPWVGGFTLTHCVEQSLESATVPHPGRADDGGATTTMTELHPGQLYLAPEQHRGERGDEASDQYSFCLVLYEALTGELPFVRDDDSFGSLAAAKHEAPRWYGAKAVARSLRRAILTGLEPSSHHRHHDMDTLLQRLERPPRSRRLVWGMAGAAVLSSATAAMAGVLGADELRVCDSGSTFADGWSERRATVLDRATSAVGVEPAKRALEQVDAYVGRWSEVRTTLCEPDPDEDATARAGALACLEQRELALAAAVDGVVRSVSTDAQALDGLLSLSPLEECDSTAARVTWAAPSVELRRVTEQLAHAEVDARLGDDEAAADRLRAVEVDVANLDPRTRARFMRLDGRVAVAQGREADARAALESAYHIAWSAAVDDEAADAAIERGLRAVAGGMDLEDARLWLERAQTALGRWRSDDVRRAAFHSAKGRLLEAAGRYEAAGSHFAEAVGLGDTAGEAMALPRKIEDLVHLGRVLVARGRFTEARPYFHRALVSVRRGLWDGHPSAIEARLLLARSWLEEQNPERAVRTLEEALSALNERGLGDSLPALRLESWLALAQIEQGAAQAGYERSVRILSELNLGDEDSVSIEALARLATARALLALERPNESVEAAKEAVEVARTSFGARDLRTADARETLALASLELGRAQSAVQLLEEVLASRLAAPHVCAIALARTRFALARALWKHGRDRSAARASAGQAMVELELASVSSQELRGDIERWLAER